MTYSALASREGMGPKGRPVKSISRPAIMMRTPARVRRSATSQILSSKNWASSIPTTSIPTARAGMAAGLATGIQGMREASCETMCTVSYRVSVAGLKMPACLPAICTRLSLRINSSLLPENMQPQMTSIQPVLCV